MVITGASSGIGLVVAKYPAKRGACVVLAARNEKDLHDATRGQVYGSRTAVQHLRRTGGALINVGSALSDRAIPLQGGYCAAKHALKAFTHGLRMELEEEGLPIAVTLVKPASIDTPFFEKARTYLGVEPQPVPPVYAPEVVSEVILHAAEHPLRELTAGGSGAKSRAAWFAPRPADLHMERWTFDSPGTDWRRCATPGSGGIAGVLGRSQFVLTASTGDGNS